MRNLDSQKRCYYCGNQLMGRGSRSNKYPRGNRHTRDHVVPRALGGSGEENYVDACLACNAEKGALSIEEFRAVVAIREGILTDVKQYWRFYGETPEHEKINKEEAGKRNNPDLPDVPD